MSIRNSGLGNQSYASIGRTRDYKYKDLNYSVAQRDEHDLVPYAAAPEGAKITMKIKERMSIRRNNGKRALQMVDQPLSVRNGAHEARFNYL